MGREKESEVTLRQLQLTDYEWHTPLILDYDQFI